MRASSIGSANVPIADSEHALSANAGVFVAEWGGSSDPTIGVQH